MGVHWVKGMEKDRKFAVLCNNHGKLDMASHRSEKDCESCGCAL